MYYWLIYSTSTYYIGNGSGTHKPDSSVALNGFELLGPYDDIENLMPSDVQAAYDNPDAYLYQNGGFVNNPNWPTMQLQYAKEAQKALIQDGLSATLNNGFTSKTTGHKYVTTTNGQSNMEGDLKRFELDSTLTSVQFFTMDASWQPHTYDQLKSAFLDGGLWKDAQYSQQTTLNNQIDDPTTDTVDKVKAIVWSEAAY